MAEAAPILGAAIGLPDLRYVQFPYDQVKDGMLRSGISPGYADAIMEIVRSFNERRINGRTGRTDTWKSSPVKPSEKRLRTPRPPEPNQHHQREILYEISMSHLPRRSRAC